MIERMVLGIQRLYPELQTKVQTLFNLRYYIAAVDMECIAHNYILIADLIYTVAVIIHAALAHFTIGH